MGIISAKLFVVAEHSSLCVVFTFMIVILFQDFAGTYIETDKFRAGLCCFGEIKLSINI